MEAWHRGIQSLLSEIHPYHLEVHKRTKTLSTLSKLKDTEIEGLIASRNAAQRRPAYEFVNRRIKNIVLDYQNRDISRAAHNIMH